MSKHPPGRSHPAFRSAWAYKYSSVNREVPCGACGAMTRAFGSGHLKKEGHVAFRVCQNGHRGLYDMETLKFHRLQLPLVARPCDFPGCERKKKGKYCGSHQKQKVRRGGEEFLTPIDPRFVHVGHKPKKRPSGVPAITTEEEAEQLVLRYIDGASASQIAKEMDLHPNCVMQWLRKLVPGQGPLPRRRRALLRERAFWEMSDV